MRIAKYDELRFRYEYGGESIQELCAEYGYLIAEVTEYAEGQNWSPQSTPSPGKAEDVHTFYTNARRRLSIAAVQHSIALWSKITKLEAQILDKAQAKLNMSGQLDEAGHVVGELDALDLTRLVKVVETLHTSSTMYAEALSVPAQNDSDKLYEDDDDLVIGEDPWKLEVVHSFLTDKQDKEAV